MSSGALYKLDRMPVGVLDVDAAGALPGAARSDGGGPPGDRDARSGETLAEAIHVVHAQRQVGCARVARPRVERAALRRVVLDQLEQLASAEVELRVADARPAQAVIASSSGPESSP